MYVPAANWRRLQELAGTTSDWKLIYYIRNPVHHVYSVWQEEVKHGSATRFEDILSRAAAGEVTFPCDSTAHLTTYCDAFGADNVQVFVYDNVVAGSDLLEHFAAEVLQLPLPAVPERINTSLDPGRIELMRALNALNRGHWQSMNALEKVTAVAQLSETEPVKKFLAAIRLSTLTVSSQVFEDRIKDLNTRFGQRIRNRPAADQIFAGDTARQVRIPTGDSLTDTQLRTMLEDVIVLIDRTCSDSSPSDHP